MLDNEHHHNGLCFKVSDSQGLALYVFELNHSAMLIPIGKRML